MLPADFELQNSAMKKYVSLNTISKEMTFLSSSATVSSTVPHCSGAHHLPHPCRDRAPQVEFSIPRRAVMEDILSKLIWRFAVPAWSLCTRQKFFCLSPVWWKGSQNFQALCFGLFLFYVKKWFNDGLIKSHLSQQFRLKQKVFSAQVKAEGKQQGMEEEMFSSYSE